MNDNDNNYVYDDFNANQDYGDNQQDQLNISQNGNQNQENYLVDYMCESLQASQTDIQQQLKHLVKSQKYAQVSSQQEISQLKYQLDDTEVVFRESLLEKQKLRVESALYKKSTKSRQISTKYAKKSELNKTNKQTISDIDLNNVSRSQYEFQVPDNYYQLTNDQKNNIQAIQRLITIKEQQKMDKGSYEFCIQVLDEIYFNMDQQLDVVEQKKSLDRLIQKVDQQQTMIKQNSHKIFNDNMTMTNSKNEKNTDNFTKQCEVNSKLSNLKQKIYDQTKLLLNKQLKEYYMPSLKNKQNTKIIDVDINNELAKLQDVVNMLKNDVVSKTSNVVQKQKLLNQKQLILNQEQNKTSLFQKNKKNFGKKVGISQDI